MRAKIEAASADDLSVHITDKNNPHGVTAEQIGAAKAEDLKSYLPLTGGAMTGAIINKNTSQGIVWSSDALELKALDTSKKTSATARIHENGVFGVELKNSADDLGGHFRVLHGNGYDGVYYNSDAARFDDDHRLAQQSYVDNAVKYRTNPNLLDNWFFGRPVNQRNGYYIPQGAIIYSDSSLSESSKIGPAAYACMVVESTNTCVKVKDTKSPAQYYYAAVSSAVPGYCTVGYTVDRWWLGFDSGSSSLQLTNDGVIYNAGSSGGYENFS